MNQIKTLCYDMLLDIIEVAEKKNLQVKPQSSEHRSCHDNES